MVVMSKSLVKLRPIISEVVWRTVLGAQAMKRIANPLSSQSPVIPKDVSWLTDDLMTMVSKALQTITGNISTDHTGI